MKQRYVRQPNGRVIGLIRDFPERTEARTSGGVLLGWYDKISDSTRHANGQLFAWGDAVSQLLS